MSERERKPAEAPVDQQAMLKSILNGMEALICVCNADTFEILFLNDSIRAQFGIEGDGVGQLCYKLLQHLDEPCPPCPHRQILEEPDKALVWEHREMVKNRILRKTARIINWDGEKKGHLEYAIDITELRDTQEQLERQNQLLHTVNEISAILLQSNTETDRFETELQRSLGIIAKAVDADRAYIWENHMIRSMHCGKICEWSGSAAPRQEKDPVESTAYQEAMPYWEGLLSQGKCVNGPISGMIPAKKNLLAAQGVLSVLVVPIFLKDLFWGFVSFEDCHTERIFSENEENILRSASELIANALIRNQLEDNIRLLETEAGKIYYDPLTGIYNRRYFDETMKRLLQSLSRSGSMLSVLMIDIDFFKKYNDTYGHSEGDACLKAVAETLSGVLSRADDFVARYGGEEFVAVLPNTGAEGAELVAGKLLEAIRNRGIPHRNNPAGCVTVSIGVVTGKAEYHQTTDLYIQRADKMLYESKSRGRNQSSSAKLREICLRNC